MNWWFVRPLVAVMCLLLAVRPAPPRKAEISW